MPLTVPTSKEEGSKPQSFGQFVSSFVETANEGPLSSYERALVRWSIGNMSECLAILDASGEPASAESELLRARVYVALRQPQSVIEVLSNATGLWDSPDSAATAAMLLGTGYLLLGDLEQAETSLQRARIFDVHHTVSAEIAYYTGFLRYQRGECDRAREELAPALQPCEDIVYARALTLLAYIHAAQEDFCASIQTFDRALFVLSKCRLSDAGLHANIVHGVITGRAETEVVSDDSLVDLLNRVIWREQTADFHLRSWQFAGLAYARSGKRRKAAECFIRATFVAPANPLTAVAYAALAMNAMAANEMDSANAFLLAAKDIVLKTNWCSITGETRLTLIDVALAAVRLGDHRYASDLFDRYLSSDGDVDLLEAISHDRRLDTYLAHVRGLILGAEGAVAKAGEILSDVEHAWVEMHYVWRAREAAQDLKALGVGSKAAVSTSLFYKCDDVGTMRLGLVPKDMNRRGQPVITVQWSPSQIRLLRLIDQGHTETKDLAQLLGCSAQTVRISLHKLYSKLGIDEPSRAKLLARLRYDVDLRTLIA